MNRIISALAILLATAGGSLRCDENPSLSLLVLGDKTELYMDDSLDLEVRLQNNSPNDVLLFDRLTWGPRGLLVDVVDRKSNERVSTGRFDDEFIPPSALRDRSQRVRLHTGHFLGCERRIPVSDLVNGPGEYDIFLHYRSPLPEEHDQRPIMVSARPLRLVVRPGSGK